MQSDSSPIEYEDLRAIIHNFLYDYFDHELECAQNNEFDFEFMEAITDNILRLIRRQGGQV